MVPVTSLRAGSTFEEDGEIFEVLTYSHVKMGRGSANVKIKVKNLKSGAQTEKGFISSAKVNGITLDKRATQFLYKDQESAHFMDPETFEQYVISPRALSGLEFLKEGEVATLQFYNGESLSLLLPPKVKLKVIETTLGVRGDSVTNIYKDAILENGMRIRVPLFIKQGEEVVVDTKDGSYTRRA